MTIKSNQYKSQNKYTLIIELCNSPSVLRGTFNNHVSVGGTMSDISKPMGNTYPPLKVIIGKRLHNMKEVRFKFLENMNNACSRAGIVNSPWQHKQNRQIYTHCGPSLVLNMFLHICSTTVLLTAGGVGLTHLENKTVDYL